MSLIFIFSNKTHFQTALPLLERFKKKYELLVIFNLMNESYSIGLEEYYQEYKDYFKEILILKKINSKLVHIVNLFKVKTFIKQITNKYKVQSSVQFIEGADIDWLVIGLLKEVKIKTVVLQWAITWEPHYYDSMKNNLIKRVLKEKTYKIIKSFIGLNYPTMKYLGDGNADYLLTMGDFWTEQFLKHHCHKEKFISVGNPRFLALSHLNTFKNKDKLLFVTGAGTSLYAYGLNQHLEDIEQVYSAYTEANSKYALRHKVHPRDKYVDEIKVLSKKYKNIEVEQEESVEVLLKDTLATIIIRSTVGLEALIAGSRLLVYNNSNQVIGFNYSAYGLGKEAVSSNDLTNYLKNIDLISPVDLEYLEYYIKTKNILEDIEHVICQD